MGDKHSRRSNWEGPVWTLMCNLVQEEMPVAYGGVSQREALVCVC